MIYIITPNDDRNYGAVLQANALQSFLGDLGFDSRFIVVRKELNSVLKLNFSSIKEIVKSLFVLRYQKELKTGCEKFSNYVSTYQKCTETYDDYTDLEMHPPIGEAYIVGSDQVWPETNLLPLNMLSFVPKGLKKLSYAASMGNDTISSEYIDSFKFFLSDFSSVSVREKKAVSAIKAVYNGEVTQNIDPTLLKSKKYWEIQEKKYEGQLPKEYVLVYLIYVPNNINYIIKQIKDHFSLPIVFVSNTAYKNVKCDYYIRDAGPQEFLWLIHHSSFVVSSSYHGVVFSIIYHIKFYAINNPVKTARLDSLLALLDMQDHLKLNDSIVNETDWDAINTIIEKEKAHSKSYLERALSDE